MGAKRKKKIVVGGTFDILHTGHLKFLDFAQKQANEGELIVIIARDSTVKQRRGHPPIFGENERKEIVESLEVVNKAILGKPTKNHTFLDIISSIRPDIIVLGHDQPFKEDKLMQWARRHNINLEVVRAKEFKINGISNSSEAREKARRLNNEN